NKLLAGVPGLTIESLQIEPVQGVETLTSGMVVDAGASSGLVGDYQIVFNFSVSGSADALRQALTNLERSIRVIDVTNLHIENQGSSQIMTVQARAFYEPVKVIDLYDKVVKP